MIEFKLLKRGYNLDSGGKRIVVCNHSTISESTGRPRDNQSEKLYENRKLNLIVRKYINICYSARYN